MRQHYNNIEKDLSVEIKTGKNSQCKSLNPSYTMSVTTQLQQIKNVTKRELQKDAKGGNKHGKSFIKQSSRT